ncbi:MAG: cytochrome c oxidase subunit II [Actinomycetota bacterium]
MAQRFALSALAPLLLAGCQNSNFGMPDSATVVGGETARLWRIFFIVALAVGALVLGLIAWSVIAYRRKGAELPKQTHANIPMEVVYTVIPVVIVIVLFAATMSTLAKTERKSSRPDLVIETTGFQWQWRFHYPAHDIDVLGATGRPPVMVVPTGKTVRIVLTSTDVIHGFFVPEFMVKHDAIPGRKTTFDLNLKKAGTFESGRCTVFCGLDHDRMSFIVKAVSPASFEAWAAKNKAQNQALTSKQSPPETTDPNQGVPAN